MLVMMPGHRCSLQKHERKTETVIVVGGELEIEVPDLAPGEKLILYVGGACTIPCGTVHRMSVDEDQVPCTYFECSSPNCDEDVIRISDDYDRVQTS